MDQSDQLPDQSTSHNPPSEPPTTTAELTSAAGGGPGPSEATSEPGEDQRVIDLKTLPRLETLSLHRFLQCEDWRRVIWELKFPTGPRGGPSQLPVLWGEFWFKTMRNTIMELRGSNRLGRVLPSMEDWIPVRDLVSRDTQEQIHALQLLDFMTLDMDTFESTYIQVFGFRQPIECEQCQRSNGPWMECVHLIQPCSRYAGTMACANCITTGNRNKCSYVPGAWPPRPPTPELPGGWFFHPTV